ncbi:mannitol dehydrogenase family protein [Actinoplanes teichomyceticus]|uniref:Mannitol-1-phosphate 5-dehydrogenase n=1 Tax=Actinoplanes teichomyceticus TaxID=1867 RepID=A0A561WBE6_ACTTI|nr:mannitol dehydrogenase family protein [Actinoplanes teichomyceticus]TWG21165.1 mannitol 2-dehydrogenase [Actinoplanes teichomyceticus]GIF14986.1 mannitol 2-dehydrogenase [Actinoplanes teichomyceticus]
MIPLTAATLPDLPAGIPGPRYDRARCTTGIVHFGVGGFHRAHQAMYIDRLMNAGKALDWAICGVGVMPGDRRMNEILNAQDGLYTLVVKAPDGTLTPRVVGSIREHLFAPDDPERVIRKLADPAVRIVSLTVTEGGYAFPAADGTAGSMFALITDALARRRESGTPPFTIMSCDNIQENGDTARRSFVAFARRRDPGLADWIAGHVRFPNSMVDRITPVTTDRDITEIGRRFGVHDRWPVVCEPFTQWVVEDDFSLGRPPLEDAGVQLAADVRPYEMMKLRLLNAGHQALCYFGHLAGYRLVHEVCQDRLFATFLLAYLDREARPTLAPVPGIDLAAYQRQLIERFSNAAVRDTVARLCADTSDRIPKWVLPVIRHHLATGGEIHRAAAVVASWARYAEGVDEHGAPIEVVDRLRDILMANAGRQRADPLAFVAYREVFGDLVEHERFVSAYRAALASLHHRGARATLQWLVTP